VRAQEEEIAALPASFEEGAAIALAGLTSLQALRDVARVGEGTRLLINGGSGGVGTAAIQIAKILGAHVTTISSARNRELCRSLGADQTLEYGVPAQRFDCLFDVYGNGLKAEAAMVVSTVPTLGRLVLNALRTSKRLVIVRPRRKDLELLGQWMASGRLRAVIDSRHSLEHVRDAFRVLESRRARGKILIEP
jgi:NADPH:quinone reductase-like Zn-dependent oxidoreductase